MRGGWGVGGREGGRGEGGREGGREGMGVGREGREIPNKASLGTENELHSCAVTSSMRACTRKAIENLLCEWVCAEGREREVERGCFSRKMVF